MLFMLFGADNVVLSTESVFLGIVYFMLVVTKYGEVSLYCLKPKNVF